MPAYYSTPISGLIPDTNGVLATNVYPATDVTDLTQSPAGTTKKYSIQQLQQFLVQTIIGSNIESAYVATTGADLDATYNNGVDGVGATLTNAGSFAALTIDSIPLAVGESVLVKDQSLAYENGVYIVTTVGDNVSIPWVLTRASYYDGSTRVPMQGDFIGIVSGNINALTFWFQVEPNPIVIGTTPIVFDEGAGSSGNFTWETVSGTSQNVNNNTGYIPLNGSQTVFTLPATCPAGFTFAIEGLGNGGWQIQANGGQYIRFISTLSSAGGTCTSRGQYDNCSVVCVTANVEFKLTYAGSAGLIFA